MLTGKQKRYLRGLAQTEKSLLQIGKSGITKSFLDNVKHDLERHELLKISVLQNSDVDIKEAAFDICAYTKAELVQVIGKTIVLYKKNHKEPKIELPK